MNMPVLFLFGGLPGCGKTTIAKALARKTGACHLRIDTLEQALIRVGLCAPGTLQGEGYQIACELAKDQLNNGISVIADCVNPLELTRDWWRAVAASAGCRAVEVELICSDAALHRHRAESRPVDIEGLKQPDWNAIQQREYEAWSREHLVLDTAHLSVDEAVARIVTEMAGEPEPRIAKVEALVRSLNLGRMSAVPRPLTGGLSHFSCRVDTDRGGFVMKTLNPAVMRRPEAPGNYRRSEALAQALADEIAAVPAIPFQGDVLIPFEGSTYMVFPWVPGRTLAPDEITPAHCAEIGAVLGRIHARRITMPESAAAECPIYSWRNFGLTERQVDDLARINRQAHDALAGLRQDSVMSHRDLDPKNVLWDGETPHIIDWEAAGMIPPSIEFWEACMNWGQDSKGEIIPARIEALRRGYGQWHRLPEPDWGMVSSAGYAGMLGWLNYNLIRSASTEIPPEERTLGKEQVAQTLHELCAYESKRSKIMAIL